MAVKIRDRKVVSVQAPSVSVVVPSYNYGRFLRDCVESLLAQEGVDLDVLIMDDGSTDDTLDVAQRLIDGDPRVRVLSQENRGMIPTINDGLWRADGQYAVKIDADDMLTPGSLRRSLALLEAHPTVDFVYGRALTFTENPAPRPRSRQSGWSVWAGPEWLSTRCRRAQNCIFQPEVVMRTSALHRAGPYRADLPHTSDFEMWLRLAATGDVGRVNGPHQAWMRQHASSMQRTVHAGLLCDLQGRLAAFEAAFDGPAGATANAVGLRATARQALAAEALRAACTVLDRDAGVTVHVPRPAPWIDDSLEDYVRFALEAFPAATTIPAWKSLEDRRHSSAVSHRRRPAPKAALRGAVRRFVWATSEDLAWRWWS